MFLKIIELCYNTYTYYEFILLVTLKLITTESKNIERSIFLRVKTT